MLRANVRQRSATVKDAVSYDHFVAIDWSLKTMAIAHASRRDQIPRVFQRPTDLNV